MKISVQEAYSFAMASVQIAFYEKSVELLAVKVNQARHHIEQLRNKMRAILAANQLPDTVVVTGPDDTTHELGTILNDDGSLYEP